MIRHGGLLLLALIVLLAAAGCGDEGDNGDGGDAGGSADAAPEPRAEGDVTWCIGKDTTGAFSTVVRNFNEANPDANARLLELPESADEQRRLQIQRLRAEHPECDVLGMDVPFRAIATVLPTAVSTSPATEVPSCASGVKNR